MINIDEKLADGTELYGWKSEPTLIPFVPDFAYYLTDKKIFSEEECKEWNDYLLEQELILLDRFRIPTGNGGTGLGEHSITSRYGHFNTLHFDFYLVPKLKKAIHDGIKTILSVSDNTTWQETIYANSWFNVMRKGEFMDMHSHVSASELEQGFYGFHVSISAIETMTSYYHPAKYQNETFHVPNKIGYVTLFPYYIPHGVSPNRYETPRISIAGDIYPSTWLKAPDPPNYTRNLVEIGTYNNHNNELQKIK